MAAAPGQQGRATGLRQAPPPGIDKSRLLRPVRDEGGRVNPDCRDGKHASCSGDGWDATTDHTLPL
jgi:hypothetical protein